MSEAPTTSIASASSRTACPAATRSPRTFSLKNAASGLPVLKESELLAASLRLKGYHVDFVRGGTPQQLLDVLRETQAAVKPGSMVVVWFAGYAAQSRGQNYLLPIDAKIWNERDVRTDGVAIDDLLSMLRRAGAGQSVVFVDASRRNPFERRFRSYSHGLAPLESGADGFVVASLPANAVADDVRGTIGPFATSILKELETRTTHSPDDILAVASKKRGKYTGS